MGIFLIKRLSTFVATLLAASVLIFMVQGVLPGNAAQVMLGESATPESVAALSAKLGLDQTAPVRYGRWVKGLLTGDLGTSVSYDVPVADLIAERLAVTAPLALMAMLLTTVIALALGIYAASHHDQAGDVGVMAASQLGIAIPNFWFAILLILVFAVKLQWFSAGGFSGWADDPWQAFKALVLPAVALAVVQAAILARITRSAVLDVLREDFVRTARAKGASSFRVIGIHALRNALIPVVTTIGLQVGTMLAGAILTETIFSWPGIGKWLVEAIGRRDYPVVQGGLLMSATVVILVNLSVDLLYGVINPRIRHH